MDAFWAAPPVTRTLTALTAATSIIVHGGIVAPFRVIFYLPAIFTLPKPEIWRFFTPFWLTGPGLMILFDTFFLWRYSSTLEEGGGRFSQPGDYFVYIIFLATSILVLAGFVLRDYVFASALLLGIAYTYSQDNKGKKVSFFIVTFNVIWLPWAMLGLTLVLGGPGAAMSQGTGLIAAHLYDFLTRIWPTFGGGRNYIQTPRFVRKWFGADRPGVAVRGYGTAFRPGDQQSRSQTTSSSSTFGFSSAWSGRGQGRRLGGE